jgi:multidrug efflux system membrane fusion protein
MSNPNGRRTRAAGAAAAVLASLAFAGCAPPPAPPPPPPPKVTVAFPELRPVEEHELFNGWTAAVETVEVRARVRGHIETVHFRDGDIVKAGDPLFTLDTRPFQASVDQARADRAALEAQLVAARKERDRLQDLLGKGGASVKQVEKQQADVAALEARIAAAAAQVQRAELDLEYAHIASPIAGRTSRALLTEGNLVGAGGSDPLLTTVVSVDPIHVFFDIPEPSLLKYRAVRQALEPEKLGLPASAKALPFSFALDTDEGWPREGLLDFAENVLDSTTGTLRVRGVVRNPDGFLIPGTRVHVRMVTRAAAEALLVPDAALLADQSLRYVLVVGADGKVQRRDVLPGRLLDDGLRVVLPGRDPERDLRPADRVIVEGQARARLNTPDEALDRDGQPVAPRGAAPAAAPR